MSPAFTFDSSNLVLTASGTQDLVDDIAGAAYSGPITFDLCTTYNSVAHCSPVSIAYTNCSIKPPSQQYLAGYSEPFYAVKQSTDSLHIMLSPYTLASTAGCGSVVYTKGVAAGSFDPFTPGYDTASSDTELLFDSIHAFDEGLMTVQIDVNSSLDPSLAPAYTINVPVTVIDCASETMTLTGPADNMMVGSFPTFLHTYQWDEFTFDT